MFVRRLASAISLALLSSAVLPASDLRDLLTDFVRAGVTLEAAPICATDPTNPNCHVAHFEGAAIAEQVKAFQAVGTSIGQQLSSFPLPSSSGGFTYTYDPRLGTFTRGADSFGPIYAERADTVGRGRFNLGINYSHFSYDRINDVDLSNGNMRILFLHSTKGTGNFIVPWFRGDVVQGSLSLDIKSDITAFVANYGVTDRFDVGFALPVESVSVKARADLTIDHLSTSNPGDEDIHQFDCTVKGVLNCTPESETLKTSGSASGIGDVLLRMKYRLTSSPTAGIALGSDVRFPTGKEEDLLGTGVTQIKGFLIASAHLGAFSPHVNAGYTWAIHRCQGLSSTVPTGSTTSPREDCRTSGSGGVPDEINYTGGFDFAFGPRVTFIADVIGRTYRNTKVVALLDRSLTFNTNDKCKDAASCAINPPILNNTTRPFIGAEAGTGNVNTLTGAVGFKVNPFGNLLVTVNGLFSLTKKGLQDKFTPLVGFDYAF
jgi:hypothetical protein